MKKSFKKRFILMVTAILSMLAFSMPNLTANAAVAEPNATNVVITKLVSTTPYPNGAVSNVDGSQKSLSDLETALKMPSNSLSVLQGVKFTVYTLPTGTTKDSISGKTSDQIIAMATSNKTLDATDVNGQASVSLPTGSYWVVESAAPSTVSSSLGIPFFLELPVMNTTNDGYLTDLYVYPKNVAADLPAPRKTVDTLENLKSTHDIGQVETWNLQATVPSNIKDYSKFGFTDTISNQLNYDNGTPLSLVYGTKAQIDSNNAVRLDASTDYTTVFQPTATQAGGTLNVQLTPSGLNKLVLNYVTDGELCLSFNTKINSDAVMGTTIPNTYTLNFNNTGGTPTKPDTTTPSNEADVYTGGRQFAKVDGSTGTALAGAEFIVYDTASGTNKYMVQDPGTLAVTWTDDKAAATVFTSAGNGLVDIKGLSYSSYQVTKNDGTTITINHSYNLQEIKAPAGYNILGADVPFTIDANSYTAGAGTLDLNADGVGETAIANKKGAQIPQTGGIGAAIFVVVGLGLMGAAIKFSKKKSANK